MLEKISRRNFFARLAVATSAFPLISKKGFALQNQTQGKIPIIVCSRGGEWARKVLNPAWEVWQKTGSMMDAVEKGAKPEPRRAMRTRS